MSHILGRPKARNVKCFTKVFSHDRMVGAAARNESSRNVFSLKLKLVNTWVPSLYLHRLSQIFGFLLLATSCRLQQK